ncbi:MAG: bifunctional DedA family/phosphatase PAP2 family protein [Gammaproteobacteria bacterium]|nr:MAG: bifunctional DedA family/phosphatase PAP2 family protein [Gammaproteobacteria bacterium]
MNRYAFRQYYPNLLRTFWHRLCALCVNLRVIQKTTACRSDISQSMSYNLSMPEDFIANLILTLQQHSTLALFFIFFIAFSESLILIGLLVPGAILMILFGALIVMDALEFWPTVFFAVAGAVAGDGLSFWLGKRYQHKLLQLWPLSKHPDILVRANQFFDRHGVKSIILSRFIGPLRPVIPAIAGMTKMPLKTFITTNIGSAMIWAPLYLLPGLLFGLSVEMASEFASKFIFLIIFLFIIIILSLWSVQRLYIFTRPYNDKAINYLLNWGEKHSIAGEVPASIFDTSHPELRGLSLAALIIFVITLVFSLLFEFVVIPDNLLPYNIDSFNQLIYYRLQTFRSPPFDNVMLWFSYLSSSHFIALLYTFLGVFFILKKDFFSLWHWLAAIALPVLLSPLLNNNLTSSLQNNLNINIQPLNFAAVISALGFLTVIINSGLSYNKQRFIYYISSTLILFLMLAQLYFAQQFFSQILSGLFIGLIWFNLLAIAYRRHIKNTVCNKTRKEIIFIIMLLLLYPGWKTIQQENIYLPSDNYYVMGADSWIESGWELLPVIRQGINANKNDLFNLQWLGTKKNISSQLSQMGFSTSRNSVTGFSNWFLESVKINQLPVLPHIHQGEYETLRYYRYDKHNKELTVIRLWPSNYKLKQNNSLRPLWFGSINFMEIKRNLGITYLVTKNKSVTDASLANMNLKINKKVVLKNRTVFLVQ